MSSKGAEYIGSPAKRRLDIIVGLGMAALLSPVGLSCGAAAAYDNRSLDPFFRQLRYSSGGEEMTILKFRTLARANDDGPLIDYGTFDPRASKIGIFLRRSGLDELPQLTQVISGDMSLVGIRPMTQESLEHLEEADAGLFNEWRDATKDVPFGLTGLSQLYGHYQRELGADTRSQSMRLDMKYAKQASLAKDLRIIARTPVDLIRASLRLQLPGSFAQAA